MHHGTWNSSKCLSSVTQQQSAVLLTATPNPLANPIETIIRAFQVFNNLKRHIVRNSNVQTANLSAPLYNLSNTKVYARRPYESCGTELSCRPFVNYVTSSEELVGYFFKIYE